MRYDKETILQGNEMVKGRQETPSTFHAANQLEKPKTKTRMAGQMGARALELMNNPEEKARTENFMSLFGQSNEGMQFNQAKMIQAAPPQPADKKMEEEAQRA